MSSTMTSFPIWGTTAHLLVADAGRLAEAKRALDEELAAVGAACDRFRPASELSRLNAAGGRPLRVSPLFGAVLTRALRVAEATGGAVDPTVGGALVTAGYDRDLAEVSRTGPALNVRWRPAPGWRAIELTDGGRIVRIPAGVSLDLGAIAKAYAADRAARRAARIAGTGVLVSLGGDIAVSGPAPGEGWSVRVAENHRARPDAPGQSVTIRSGGLATSSTTVRRWRRGERWLHHIIDPALGCPVNSCWRTVSVTAATCVDANAAATACLVRGRGADSWLGHRGLPARLIRLDGSAVTVAGWPDDQDQAIPA